MSKVPSSSPAAATSFSVAATSSSSSQYTYANAAYFTTPFHLQQQQPPPQPVQFPALSASATSSSTASTSSSSSAQYTYYNGSYFPTPFHLQQPPQPPPVQFPSPSVYPAFAPTPGVYPLPQFQQAQQLFQRDAQTITPEALENVKAALASSEIKHKSKAKKKGVPRKAAGKRWEDPTLAEWPKNDHRLFCGDLGNEVNDDILSKAFSRFPTFNMAKVTRDNRTGKTKGFGFVSFSSPLDLAAALKQKHGKYVGNRPIKLSKSKWQERNDNEAL